MWIDERSLRRRSGAGLAPGVVLALLLLVFTPVFPATTTAQEDVPAMPDLAAQEAVLEEAFAHALAASDSDVNTYLQQWAMVMNHAVMLDRLRTIQAGAEPTSEDVRRAAQGILQRWREARPDSPGPDLLQAMQQPDPDAQREAVLALLAEHPDSYLVAVQAAQQLQGAGEEARATRVLEQFLARQPERVEIYRQLANQARDNPTRQIEVLERWARAAPGDPSLVTAWLASRLPRQDPAATAAVLDRFFEGPPAGGDFLRACENVLRNPDLEAYRGAARGCIVRLVNDPEPWVAESATRQVVQIAAAEGDLAGMADSLGGLDAAQRWTALVGAADALPAPDRCAERVDLLRSALASVPPGVAEPGRVAAALRECARQPASQDLYLSLLRTAPPDQVAAMVAAWVRRVGSRVGGQETVRVSGEVPPGTTALVEQRLERQPEEVKLYEALDLLYHLDDPEGKRLDLLMRWHERAPSSFLGKRVLDLARGLAGRGDGEAAMEVLENAQDASWTPENAELLWSLHLQSGGPEAAERFARDLIGGEEARRVAAGHWLAARSALLREDRSGAGEHYRLALETGGSRAVDVAVEMLGVLAPEDRAEAAALALELCRETGLAQYRPDAADCASDVLVRASRHDAATAVLAASADLPEDLEALRTLGRTAAAGGDPEVAERALRRVLELDPRNPSSWSALAGFLEEQGRVDELVALLEPSRQALGTLESGLHRAAARALTARGRAREAIDLLLEARGALPATSGGDWSRGWIDHELRQAYRLLASEQVQPVRETIREIPPSPTTRPAPPPQMGDATATELRAAADALYSGSGGRYDPEAAGFLYRRAADRGDALATFRLALLKRLRPDVVPEGLPDAGTLYRRSRAAVAEAAAGGDGAARLLLGTAAMVGIGGTDYAAARQWLQQAADQGESWAWHNLAWMAYRGDGRNPDPVAAREAFRKGAELGNVSSMVDLALLSLTPHGSRAECDEGLAWLERAAAAGHAMAAHQLGKVLLYGQGRCATPSPAEALPWLQAAREARQPGAAFDLGAAGLRTLLLGDGAGEEVRRTALALLEESAAQHEVLAMEILALLHVSGLGVERDPAAVGRYLGEAASLGSDGFGSLARQVDHNDVFAPLLEAAAARLAELADGPQGSGASGAAGEPSGDPAAAAYLARLQSLGLAGPAEPERTVALARRGAAGGEPLAMHVLSLAYRNGDGVEKDVAEALRWLERCARTGDGFCMLFQARKLLQGEEVPRDVEAGRELLRHAADAGNWYAIEELARLLAHGAPDLPPDPAAAAPLMGHLAERGDAEARGWLAYHGYGGE